MNLILPKNPSLVKRMNADTVRKSYLDMSAQVQELIDHKLIHCPCCDKYYRPDSFYTSSEFAIGVYPICKDCLLKRATDYDAKEQAYKDNREKTIRVLNMMDLPFIETIYQQCLDNIKDGRIARGQTAYTQMMGFIKSLPAYQNYHWKDSVFGNGTPDYDVDINRKARREIKKLFGAGFTENDYLFLQDQYDDWRARTQVDSKSQETYVMQICLQLLDIDKDRKAGKDVTNKLKTLDTLMNSAKLQPKQNVNNAATDSLSFGELIEKWENEKPIPEPDPEFRDINGIGKLIRVYFAGHLSKALGLKNSYSEEYEEEMKKNTVTQAQAGESGSSDTYQQIFGAEE